MIYVMEKDFKNYKIEIIIKDNTNLECKMGKDFINGRPVNSIVVHGIMVKNKDLDVGLVLMETHILGNG